jgi:hypothetical protein
LRSRSATFRWVLHNVAVGVVDVDVGFIKISRGMGSRWRTGDKECRNSYVSVVGVSASHIEFIKRIAVTRSLPSRNSKARHFGAGSYVYRDEETHPT